MEEFGRNDLVVHMNQEHWRAIYKGEHRGCRWTGRDKFGVKRVEPLCGSERFLDSLSRIPFAKNGNPTTNVRVTHYAICHSFIHCSITGDVYNQSFLFKKEKYLKQPGGRFEERVGCSLSIRPLIVPI